MKQLPVELVQHIFKFVDFPFWQCEPTVRNCFAYRKEKKEQKMNNYFALFQISQHVLQNYKVTIHMDSYADKVPQIANSCRVLCLTSGSRYDYGQAEIVTFLKQAPYLQTMRGVHDFDIQDVANLQPLFDMAPKTLKTAHLVHPKSHTVILQFQQAVPYLEKLTISFGNKMNYDLGTCLAGFLYLRELHLDLSNDCNIGMDWKALAGICKLYIRNCQALEYGTLVPNCMPNLFKLYIHEGASMFPYESFVSMASLVSIRIKSLSCEFDEVANAGKLFANKATFELYCIPIFAPKNMPSNVTVHDIYGTIPEW